MTKAKVFISCGQRNDKEERYGKELIKYLEERGFDPYFAEKVHSAQGVAENIFKALKESEYFVAINFNRKDSKYGSLYGQQELAIAAFLGLEIRVFSEEGIERGGFTQHLIINEEKVKSPEDVIKYLDANTKDWDPKSKRVLRLTFDNHHYNFDTRVGGEVHKVDWYHITVHNLSSSIDALDCRGYVQKIEDETRKKVLLDEDGYNSELQWAAIGLPLTTVLRKKKRDLDAFFYDKTLQKIFFNSISYSSGYGYPSLGKGIYKITFAIYSEKFPISYIIIKFKFDNNVEILSVETPEGGT